MKAILLAAGKGRRISRMVKNVPKSTLPINGTPLIQRTVDVLVKHGMEVVVCIGYRQEAIKTALKDYDIKYYTNPFFDITNSIASLWFAREELKDDVLIMNADVFFEEAILQMILNDPNNVVMAVDKSRINVGDYFFSTMDNGCIRAFGKELPIEHRSCEYVGMAKITGEFIGRFVERLDQLVHMQKHEMWWENILYSFAKSGEADIHTKDVEGMFWAEIDYFDDYERILNYIKNQKEIEA